MPAGPATGSPSGPASGATGGATGASAPGRGPRTGGPKPGQLTASNAPFDPTTWETWWKFHRDLFIDARIRIDPRVRATLSDDRALAAARAGRPDGSRIVAVAVPALMQVVHGESNPELLRSALISLARIDGPTDGPLARWDADLDLLLASFLAHPQLSVSETAALAIGLRGRVDGARLLEAVLNDSTVGREHVARPSVPDRTRAFAAFGLGLCAQRTASEDLRRWIVHALVGAVDHESGTARDVQGAVVAALGLTRLDAHTAYFDRVVSFKRDLLDEAERMPPSAARVALVADLYNLLADDARPIEARAQVPTAIANVLQGADEALRAECVREFVRILKSATLEHEIRAGVMMAFGTVVLPIDTPHDRDARALLMNAARIGSRPERGFALVSAGRIGHAAWLQETQPVALQMESLLVEALVHGKSGAQGWAALGLGILGDAHGLLDPARANEELRRVLVDDRNQSNASAAAIALGLRRDKGATESVRARALGTGGDEVRGRFALALGLLLDCDARGSLRELLVAAESRPSLLREVVVSLALLGESELTAALVDALERAPTQAVRVAYAESLALVGDARALAPLSSLATSDKASVGARTHAVRALGSVADLDPLPWNASLAFNAQYLAACDALVSLFGTGVLDPR